ncbi:MAG: hypothetical protein M1334_04730 [Patescibacteria group bacterium]|nr:hypothetical protein [Patescibacteria group bacterium]
MKAVIGLTGKPLAGKETVGDIIMKIARGSKSWVDYFKDDYLENRRKIMKLTASRQRFRDVLEETLKLWNIEVNRDNLQKMSQVMVAENAFGKNALSGAIYNRLIKDKAEIVIADGVRWLADEDMIRSIPEKRGLILYIKSDFNTRFARAKIRQREGEAEISIEKFREQDNVKTETYIEEIGGRADWVIKNGGDMDTAELEKQVKLFFAQKIFPLL